MDKKHMNEQANLAFEFLDKLYFEISYMIKEIEGLLQREDEGFGIGRPRGYGITAGGSTGLDSPDWWWYKRFSVFFLLKEKVKTQGGRTQTYFKDQKDLKLLYLIVNLSDKEIPSPKIAMGILHNITCKSIDYYKKFEDATVYYLNSIWDKARENSNFADFLFEDKHMKFEGKFIIRDLFDINTTQDIQKKLLGPVLKQYRSL